MKISLHIGMAEPDDILIDLKHIGCNLTETSREIDDEVANSDVVGEVPDFGAFLKIVKGSFITRRFNTPDSLEAIYDLNGNELWSQ